MSKFWQRNVLRRSTRCKFKKLTGCHTSVTSSCFDEIKYLCTERYYPNNLSKIGLKSNNDSVRIFQVLFLTSWAYLPRTYYSSYCLTLFKLIFFFDFFIDLHVTQARLLSTHWMPRCSKLSTSLCIVNTK